MNFFASSGPSRPKTKPGDVKGVSLRQQYVDRVWIELQKLDPSISRTQFMWAVLNSSDTIERDLRRISSGQVTMDQLIAEDRDSI